MTTLRPASVPSAIAGPPNGFGGAPPPRRPRNIVGAALGVLLVVFCSTAVAVYGANAGHRRPVLVVIRPVRAGRAITVNDVGEARVAADASVHAILASARAGVVGRIAAVDLVPGTLLTRGELASGPVVPPGFAVVGLNVKVGFAPAGLRAGDRVGLVLTPTPGGATAEQSQPGQRGSAGAGSLLVPDAAVYDVSATPDGQSQVVSVIVDMPSAPVLAAEGARGQISVILLGGVR